MLSANADWAGGKVGVDGITISVLPDETAILASLRAGQTDFALLNDPLVATLVPNEPNLQLNPVPGLAYNVLQLNPARKPMDDLKVRQAISCAVDRQDVLDTALVGEGKVTGPLTMPAYASDPSTLFCYTQDLDKAKALMAESSSPDGFTAKVIAATGEPPVASSEAQVLQSQLAEIGVKLEIELMELNVYVDRWLAGDFDMAVALNGGRPDPIRCTTATSPRTATCRRSRTSSTTRSTACCSRPRRDRHRQAQGDLPEVRGRGSPSCRRDLAVDLQHYTAQLKTVHGSNPRPPARCSR